MVTSSLKTKTSMVNGMLLKMASSNSHQLEPKTSTTCNSTKKEMQSTLPRWSITTQNHSVHSDHKVPVETKAKVKIQTKETTTKVTTKVPQPTRATTTKVTTNNHNNHKLLEEDDSSLEA